VLGWLADLFRGVWALWYWNIRKSVYRLRGARGRCPCQNPSDSGQAGRTGCDAALGWHRPLRFRRLCPLLQTGPEGRLVCSVDAPAVRPFWGRALLWQGGGLLAMALLVSLLVFAFLRQVGYPVRFTDVAWPPRWERINTARALHFSRLGTEAIQAGDMATGISALQLAQRYDPNHIDSALLLAQIWQSSRPEASNQLYRRLLDSHAILAPRLAQAWYRTLLARDDQTKVETLAADRLFADADETAVWLHALIHANQRTRDTNRLEQMLGRPELPVLARRVLSLELAVRTAIDPRRAAPDLRRVDPTQTISPYEIIYRTRRLVTLDEPGWAFDFATIYAGDLPDRDRIALLLDVQAARGDRSARTSLINRILRGGTDAVVLELLAAHLIRHPDAELYTLCRDALLATVRAHPAQLMPTMFALAGVHQDGATLQRLAELASAAPGMNRSHLESAANFLLNPRSRNVGTILPLLMPLGLDVSYALLEHYETRPVTANP